MEITAQTRTGLSGNQLKLLALITMTIDHVGAYLLPQYRILRIIGRLAMPIYAYMVAEGCRYTRSRAKYLALMAGLALVCQAVYFFALDSLDQCILVTFSLSICLCYLVDNARKQNSLLAWGLAAAGLAGAGFLCEILPRLLPGTGFHIDYSFFGVLLPVFIFLGRTKTEKLLLAAVGLSLLSWRSGGTQWYSLLALIPLALYSGARGKTNMKYLFYIYYPLHLVVIYGIGFLIK